jgi:hypothetical protein
MAGLAGCASVPMTTGYVTVAAGSVTPETTGMLHLDTYKIRYVPFLLKY